MAKSDREFEESLGCGFIVGLFTLFACMGSMPLPQSGAWAVAAGLVVAIAAALLRGMFRGMRKASKPKADDQKGR